MAITGSPKTVATKAYRVTYSDGGDSPKFSYLTYAYDVQHAEEKFYDSNDNEGWTLVSIDRPRTAFGKVNTCLDRES